MVAESVAPGFPKAIGSTIMDPCFKDRHVDQYRSGRVRAIDDIYNASLTDCHIELLSQFSVKANLVTPVVKDGSLLGLLIAHQCSGPRAWQEAEISFLSRLATQVGFVLDRGSLPAERKAENEAEKLLMDLSIHMRECRNLEAVMQIAVQEARKVIKADRVSVYRFNPDCSGTMVAESVASFFPKVLGANIFDPCFKERHIDQYRNGRVRAINDIHNANLTDCHIELLEHFSVKANLVAPIMKDGALLGLLIAHQCSGPRAWQEADISFFSRLATQMGLALDQVGLLEEIQQARLELEGALRPRVRAITAASFGITIADATQPEYPIIYCNPAFEKMTGYSQAEALERNCRFLQGVDTDQDAVAEIRKALREQRDCRVILKNYRKDGSPFWNDLTISPVRDELGRVTHFIGLQTDISELREIVLQVQTATQAVTETAEGNKGAVQALSACAASQSRDITAALQSIQVMTNSIQDVADGARQAKLRVQEAYQTVLAGDKAISQSVDSIHSIRKTLIGTADRLKHLGDISRRVSDVMHPVNEFVAHTNILAMNLAVSVGRAGEDPKSQEFMTVAEAVRSLAEQSEEANAGIEHLVAEIQTATQEVFAAIEAETQQLTAGVQVVEETRQQLGQVVAVSTQASELVGQLDQAAVAHSQISDSVSRTMQEVATTANQTSEQAAAVAESFVYLLRVAQELQQVQMNLNER
jgi:PAS domain S-box-containing protein